MVLNGRVGQVLGPFDSSDLLAKDGKISQFTPETSHPILSKLGVQVTPGTIIKINNVEIKVGKTGIYELDEVVNVKSLSFPYGADSDTIVDFVY
jgi:hypothetical protein